MNGELAPATTQIILPLSSFIQTLAFCGTSILVGIVLLVVAKHLSTIQDSRSWILTCTVLGVVLILLGCFGSGTYLYFLFGKGTVYFT